MVDSVAIVSGGMDSVTLLHYLVKMEERKPAVLTFRYGQKHEKEIECAKAQAVLLGCDTHLVLDLASLQSLFSSSALTTATIDIPDVDAVQGDPQPPTYVPNRNMIFLALAVAFAESKDVTDIYYGAQRHDMYGYWDTTPEFLKRLNEVYGLNRKSPIYIKAPFVTYSKAAILRVGLEMEVDYSQTWSCYKGQKLACGRCPTCAERLNAFSEVGVPDPILYTIH